MITLPCPYSFLSLCTIIASCAFSAKKVKTNNKRLIVIEIGCICYQVRRECITWWSFFLLHASVKVHVSKIRSRLRALAVASMMIDNVSDDVRRLSHRGCVCVVRKKSSNCTRIMIIGDGY